MPTHTIFYSWQSDLENSCNRGFIQDCLKDALKQLHLAETELDPAIDRDTMGVSGAADIAATLFRKIRAADLFVGDVSIINPDRDPQRRPTPNPNVLAELGYSAGFHGWERVVCVFNSAFGEIIDLPFDIRQRRIVPYKLRPGDDKKPMRTALAAHLRNAIGSVLTQPDSGKQAHSYISLDCPLTDDEYDLPQVKVHANQYQRINLRLENPLGVAMDNVHVCYRKFDLFYMPWRHKTKLKTEPVAGGYHYYWLTEKQLETLGQKPQEVRFILNGAGCGEHDLVLVWETNGKHHSRVIKVIVEPEPE